MEGLTKLLEGKLKPGEKCCGTRVAAEVPRVQLYEREAAEAPNRAQSYVPVQG